MAGNRGGARLGAGRKSNAVTKHELDARREMQAEASFAELRKMLRVQIDHALDGDLNAFKAVMPYFVGKRAPEDPTPAEPDYYGIWDFGDGKPLRLPYYNDK